VPADPNHADRNVYVRPKGYVEDHAVIRRIGDRDLFLGNRHAARPGEHDRAFEYVLSVSSAAYPRTTHHRPLTDGPGNDWADFAAAVDTARDLYDREGELLVHCEAGISRSTTVLAATIATAEGRSFADALGAVQGARPHAVPHPLLHELGVTYLATVE
jgi:atypical dual specificity phosphatase